MKSLLFFFCLLLPPALAARTYWYDIDYSRSQITFLAKSRVANANGIFRKWNFKGKIGPAFQVVGDLVIECTSLDTDNERRDRHLASGDFFDCAQHPQHVFRIRNIKGDQGQLNKANRLEVEAELTIRGITHPITVTLKREGGEEKPVLTGSLLIDRESFGIAYNSALNPIEKNVRVDVRLFLLRRADKPPHGVP